MKKQFNQQQKLIIIEKGEKFGIKQAAQVVEVHYTTVYAWKNQFEALGKKAFLEYEPPRLGRGTKEISKEDEQAILTAWKENPGYGPLYQVRYELVCVDRVSQSQSAQPVK